MINIKQAELLSPGSQNQNPVQRKYPGVIPGLGPGITTKKITMNSLIAVCANMWSPVPVLFAAEDPQASPGLVADPDPVHIRLSHGSDPGQANPPLAHAGFVPEVNPGLEVNPPLEPNVDDIPPTRVKKSGASIQ